MDDDDDAGGDVTGGGVDVDDCAEIPRVGLGYSIAILASLDSFSMIFDLIASSVVPSGV